jgi:protein ImuB
VVGRIACLLVPDLPWVALVRAHPELVGRPLAVTAGAGPRAEVLALSPEAARRGVRLPCSVAQARAVCAELAVHAASPALEEAARRALLDAALSTSPRAELAPPAAGLRAAEAAVFLDASGLASCFGSEAGFAAALSARALRLGLPAVVAVAGSRAVARIAARRHLRGWLARPAGEAGPVEVVPAGGDAAFLAPLPLELLDPPDALAEACTRFGLRRVGDLLRLPRRALLARLGADAARLLDVALGAGQEPPPPAPPPPISPGAAFAARAAAHARERKTVELAPEILSRYVGSYRLDESIEIAIVLDAGRLFAVAEATPRYELKPTAEKEFYV